MSFTFADGIVALIVFISAFLAYARGVTRETLAIGGWIIAGLVSFYLAPFIEPLIREIPYIGDFLRSSCTLSMLAAFAICFAGMLLLLSIVTPLIAGFVLDSALGPVDRALGFLFGVARGLLVVAALYLVYDLVVPPNQRLAAIENAASARLVRDVAERMRESAPDAAPDWLGSRIDRLMGACGGAPGQGDAT